LNAIFGGGNSRIIGQFHYIIEIPRGIVASDVEQVDEATGGAGNRLITLDTCELPLVRPIAFELTAPNDLHRPQRAEGGPIDLMPLYQSVGPDADALAWN